MKIYKITEASEYLGVSINTLKTLANKVRTGYDLSENAPWHYDAIEGLQRVVETSLLAPMREAWARYVEIARHRIEDSYKQRRDGRRQ